MTFVYNPPANGQAFRSGVRAYNPQSLIRVLILRVSNLLYLRIFAMSPILQILILCHANPLSNPLNPQISIYVQNPSPYLSPGPPSPNGSGIPATIRRGGMDPKTTPNFMENTYNVFIGKYIKLLSKCIPKWSYNNKKNHPENINIRESFFIDSKA